MGKFHINTKSGVPGKCTAKSGNCPFGEYTPHYATRELAQEAFEKTMEYQSFKKVRRYTRPVLTVEESMSRNELFLDSLTPSLGDLTPEQKTNFLNIVQDAYAKANGEKDSFDTADDLMREINEAEKKSDSQLPAREYFTIKSRSFGFVSPKINQASGAFESSLAASGWRTQDNQRNDRFAFERAFVRAIKNLEGQYSPEKISKSFVAIIAADDNWNFDESSTSSSFVDRTTRSAAEIAYKEIMKDKPLFEKELRGV